MRIKKLEESQAQVKKIIRKNLKKISEEKRDKILKEAALQNEIKLKQKSNSNLNNQIREQNKKSKVSKAKSPLSEDDEETLHLTTVDEESWIFHSWKLSERQRKTRLGLDFQEVRKEIKRSSGSGSWKNKK